MTIPTVCCWSRVRSGRWSGTSLVKAMLNLPAMCRGITRPACTARLISGESDFPVVQSGVRCMRIKLMTMLLALVMPALAIAGEYHLTVDRVTIDTGDFVKQGIGYNGKSPGPVLRFKEGETVRIHVTNN